MISPDVPPNMGIVGMPDLDHILGTDGEEGRYPGDRWAGPAKERNRLGQGRCKERKSGDRPVLSTKYGDG